MTDLLNVTPLAVSEWDDSLEGIARDMHGRPLNVHKLMANHPALLHAWWNFRSHVVSGGQLQQRHRELIVLRVAVHLKSWYEWASHVERGLKAGLSVDEIERVRQHELGSEWELSDALVLRAADECIHENRISLRTRTAMHGVFDATQLMDLIAICGAYVILGTMINTWGLELDEFVDVPPGIAEDPWPGQGNPD